MVMLFASMKAYTEKNGKINFVNSQGPCIAYQLPFQK